MTLYTRALSLQPTLESSQRGLETQQRRKAKEGMRPHPPGQSRSDCTHEDLRGDAETERLISRGWEILKSGGTPRAARRLFEEALPRTQPRSSLRARAEAGLRLCTGRQDTQGRGAEALPRRDERAAEEHRAEDHALDDRRTPPARAPEDYDRTTWGEEECPACGTETFLYPLPDREGRSWDHYPDEEEWSWVCLECREALAGPLD